MSRIALPVDPMAPLTTEAALAIHRLSAARDSEVRSQSSGRNTSSSITGAYARSPLAGGTVLRGTSVSGSSSVTSPIQPTLSGLGGRLGGGLGLGFGVSGSTTGFSGLGGLSGRYGSTERDIVIGKLSRSVSAATGVSSYVPGAGVPGDGIANLAELGDGVGPSELEHPLNVETKEDVRRSLDSPHEHTPFSPVRFESRSNRSRSRGRRSQSPRGYAPEFAAQSLAPGVPTPPRSIAGASALSPHPQLPVPYNSHAVPSASGGQRREEFAPTHFVRGSNSAARSIPVVMPSAVEPEEPPIEVQPGRQPRMGTVGSPHPFGPFRRPPSSSRSNSRSVPMPDLERVEGPYDAASRRQSSMMRTDAPTPEDLAVLQGRTEGFDRVTSVRVYRPHNRGILHEICTIMANIRAVPPPEIPPHVYHAWDNFVSPGSYFIKYSKTGSPHERYFDLRVLESDAMTREPYIVWSTHERAVAHKGRMHLSFLQGVRLGVDDEPAFAKYLNDDGVSIKGPINNSERCFLSRDLAMTVYFHTPNTQTVSVLSVDPAIFQAWRLVLSFLSDINHNWPKAYRELSRQSGRDQTLEELEAREQQDAGGTSAAGETTQLTGGRAATTSNDASRGRIVAADSRNPDPPDGP